MHIDINSCFATIEQQANPFLRGKSVAVAAYATKNGCILAASYPAKAFGVKTGMRVKDGLALCPNMIILPPDPPKYRFIHKKMHALLNKYSLSVHPKSIDEFVVDFKSKNSQSSNRNLLNVGLEIKERIKKEIGSAITVSIGISTNGFLAKTAASYKKPDGLFEINKGNFYQVYESLKLTNLCGIKNANAARLSSAGIYDVLGFYNADLQKLKIAFRSINSYYWLMRLHGFEIDDYLFERKSFGSQYALTYPYETFEELRPILTKLTEKTARRLRNKNYFAGGIHLSILFRDHTYWHHGMKLAYPVFSSNDFTKLVYKLFFMCPVKKPVRLLSVTVFNLQKNKNLQLDLTTDVIKKQNLTKALDKINNLFGDYTITPARIINNEGYVLDRIAFGVIS